MVAEVLSSELFWYALPAIALAGLVHGTFGIGFPMVATPLLALFTDVLTAVQITLLPTIAINMTMIARGGIEQIRVIRPHLPIIPFALLGTGLGTLLLIWLDPRPFLLLLALAIVLYLNQDRIKGVDFGWVRQRRFRAYALFGSLAGLMAGTVNVMLPVLIVLFLELGLSQPAMLVLFNLNFLTGKLTQTLLFLHQDTANLLSLLTVTSGLVPVALLALFLGMRLGRRIDADRYRQVLRGLLWLMASILVIRFILSFSG